MAKWKHSDIIPYFCDKFGTGDESCLPYLPEEWKCSIQGKNEEIDILHASDEKNSRVAGTINLLKRPSLKTWKIECFFAHPQKPEFAKVKDAAGWTPSVWVEFFEGAMYEKKVLEMTITGLNYVCYVTVENFEHSKRSGEELDTYYTIDLKEYVFTEIKHEDVKIEIKSEIPPTGNTGKIDVQATQAVTGGSKWLKGYAYTGIKYDANSTDAYKSYLIDPIQSGYNGRNGVTMKNVYFDKLPVENIHKVVAKDAKKRRQLNKLGNEIYEMYRSTSVKGFVIDFNNGAYLYRIADIIEKNPETIHCEPAEEALKLLKYLKGSDGLLSYFGIKINPLNEAKLDWIATCLNFLTKNSSDKTKYGLVYSYAEEVSEDVTYFVCNTAIDIDLNNPSAKEIAEDMNKLHIAKGKFVYCKEDQLFDKGEYHYSFLEDNEQKV